MSYGYYQPYWINDKDELEHFGIKGMKWGIRRYQNPDGTLTALGKQRYGNAENLQADRQKKKEKAIKVAKTAGKVALGIGLSYISAKTMQTTISVALSSMNKSNNLSLIPYNALKIKAKAIEEGRWDIPKENYSRLKDLSKLRREAWILIR